MNPSKGVGSRRRRRNNTATLRKRKRTGTRARLAFYTCFTGGNKNPAFIQPSLPSTKYDCYFFTNNPDMQASMQNTQWKVIMLDIPISTSKSIDVTLDHDPSTIIEYNTVDCMNNKKIRSCPHTLQYLDNYDYVCWFDTTLHVDEEKVEKLVDRLEKENKVIVLSKHVYQFGTVWGEYNEAMKYPRYSVDQDRYKKYIESKIAETGTDVLPIHYCGGFSIRKLSSKIVTKFNEEWYANILRCGIEDQISLQFVHQNYTNSILPIEYKECWKYLHE
jgi:hypothetical protein